MRIKNLVSPFTINYRHGGEREKYREQARREMAESYQSVLDLPPRTDCLVLPMPTNIANRPMHWRIRDELQGFYKERCDSLRVAGRVPKPPDYPPWLVEIRVVAYLGQQMDEGNLMNRLKWAEDWLVRNGYLTDDRKTNLRYAGFPEQRIDRKAQRLEIYLTTIEQEAPVKAEKGKKSC